MDYSSGSASFLEPEDGCVDVDRGHEGMNAAVVSDRHTSPVFQLCGRVFDGMTLYYKGTSRKMILISGFSSTGYRRCDLPAF
ncbi:hypothetical protein [Acetobacter aceti]